MAKKSLQYKGTRQEIEKLLMEFLFSLKYYSTRWRRAHTYAQLVGFLHSDKSYQRYMDLNQNLYNKTHGHNKVNESILQAA